jgi:hypothetical protein
MLTTPTVSVVRVSSLRVVRSRKALSKLPRLCIAEDCYAQLSSILGKAAAIPVHTP